MSTTTGCRRGRPQTRLVIGTLILILSFGAVPASADQIISVETDGVLFASPGTLSQVASADVDTDLVGDSCVLSVLSENQVSVHPGNDLVIRTGGVVTRIADVEAAPGTQVNHSVDLVLGPSITVDLEMGPDGVSSFGFALSLHCDAEPVPQTTVPSTTVPTTAPPGTTPTTLAPGCVDRARTGEATATSGGGATEADSSTSGCSATPETTTPPPTEPDPPLTEAADLPLPADPSGCPDPLDAKLTVVPDNCPSTDPEPTPTTTTAPAPTPPPTTVPPSSGDNSSSGKNEPQVLGLQIEAGLPITPPAQAVPASPSYAG